MNLLEALEPRIMLAGDIQAEILRGTLSITGTQGPDQITLEPGSQRGTIRISVTDGTVNGQVGSLELGGLTKGIVADLLAGNDRLIISGFTSSNAILGNTTILLGTGNDTLTVTDTRVLGTSKWSMDAGDDTLQIDDAQFHKAVKLDAGVGNDAVKIERRAGFNGVTAFENKLTVTMDEGQDQFLIGVDGDSTRKATILKPSKFDGGEQADVFFFSANSTGKFKQTDFESRPVETQPVVIASLSHDSAPGGLTNQDSLTNDASVAGTIANFQTDVTLFGGFDTSEVNQFVNLSVFVQSDGHFTLSQASLVTSFPGRLTDGLHTLNLRAMTNSGLASALVSLAFTLDTTSPAVERFGLDSTSDTGIQGDLTTNAVTISLSGTASPLANVSLNHGALTTTADATGAFQFDNVGLTLGTNSFTLQAEDAAGNRSAPVPLVLVRVPQLPSTVTAALAHDSAPGGTTNSDGITNDAAIAGSLTVPATGLKLFAGIDVNSTSQFVDLTSFVQSDGTFVLPHSALVTAFPNALADGSHTAKFEIRDNFGNTSGLFALPFTLDTTPPSFGDVGLDVVTNSGTVDDLVTSFDAVNLKGRTTPGGSVMVTPGNLFATADGSGNFEFTSISLEVGSNEFVLISVDAAGNPSPTRQVTVQRTLAETAGGLAEVWNRAGLNAIRVDASSPPVASRNLAILHIGILDAVASILNQPHFLVSLLAPSGANAEAALIGAAYRLLSYLYPTQEATFAALRASGLAAISDSAKEASDLFGQQVAQAVIDLRDQDGWDTFETYNQPEAVGIWQQTAPMFAEALEPQWAHLTPFAMTSPDQFTPDGLPPLDSQEYTDAYNEVKQYGRGVGSNRTADQTAIAKFWADGLGTYSPPGQWNQIAGEVAATRGLNFFEEVRLFAVLNVALADAGIAAWNTKFTYNSWRPIDAIQQGDTDGNPDTNSDATWTPLLVTPPFPEYISGHSTFSGAAASVLTRLLGDNIGFTTSSVGYLDAAGNPVQRSFANFWDAADEAGQSRIYGGIHFQFSNQDGLEAGREIGDYVTEVFKVTSDVTPPTIFISSPESGITVTGDVTYSGSVFDNLSGVSRLDYSLDDGSAQPVPFGADGTFALILHGVADGPHRLSFQATDNSGLKSVPKTLTFTRDTSAPTLSIDLTDNSPVDVTTTISGIADGTSSAIVALNYRIDTGAAVPVSFDPVTGEFRTGLDLSQIAIGPHTLSFTATDAAGHITTVSRSINLAEAIPFAISRVTPQNGAVDVGSTFRPQVFFTRPVDVSTLSSDNLYVADTTGQKLPATIVPANDGSFAWLFLASPAPGASTITIHVDGSSIRAKDLSSAGTAAALDADGDGTPGGVFQSRYTTVSLAKLPGTSLSGILADPGLDLKPGSFDDVRSGPDGVLMTADDKYLNPIAGAKVYILGLENEAVFTDSQGRFSFTSIPAGDIKLAIDGRTATNAPAGMFFPEMVMDLVIQPGVANTVMAAMTQDPMEAAQKHELGVYLPRLQQAILQDVSATTPTMIEVDAHSAPNLTPEERQFLTIEVQPGSLIGPDGQPLAAGQVGISTVPPELVADMLPTGLLRHTFDITIQAPGITNFATPAKMTFPNVFRTEPGTKLNFLSFDHTTGRLVIDGTATVSMDGLYVTTDPGMGVTHPGWHGLTAPGTPIKEVPSHGDDTITSDNNCSTLEELYYLGLLKAAINVWKSLPFVYKYAPLHLEHFLDGSGTPLDYADSSEMAALVMADENFQTFDKSFQGRIAVALNRLIDSGLTPTNEDLVKLVKKPPGKYDVWPSKPDFNNNKSVEDLKYSIGGTQGVDAEVQIHLNEKIKWEGFVTYTLRDVYGFDSGDETKSIFDEAARYLQAHCTAHWFPVSIKVIVPFNFHGPVTLISNDPRPQLHLLSTQTDIEVLKSEEYALDSSLASEPAVGKTVGVVGSDPRPYFRYTFDNGAVITGRGDSQGHISIFAPDNQFYSAVIFYPATGGIAAYSGRTGASGSESGFVQTGSLRAVIEPRFDSDGDGLTDIAEYVIGTNASRLDTDGDGLTDFAAIVQGLNPLGRNVVATGVVASVPLQGTANAIVVEAATENPAKQTAYVATGDYGLAVIDVSQFNKPTVLSQLDLPGTTADVAVNDLSTIAVVAATNGGDQNAGAVYLVNVTDPANPQLIRTLSIPAASQVEIVGKLAYIGAGFTLRAIDLEFGQVVQSLPLNVGITSLARERNTLYVQSEGSARLLTIDITGGTMTPLGSIAQSGNRVLVANQIAYVSSPAINNRGGGFATINVTDPAHPVLISASDVPTTSQFPISALALNGSGLAVALSSGLALGPFQRAQLMDVSDPNNTNAFVTGFDLPMDLKPDGLPNNFPSDVFIASGIAYIANGKGGLVVLNYLAPDVEGIAPTVTLSSSTVDANPNSPGLQIKQNIPVPINVTSTDDFQIRSVEMLVGGQVVQAFVSFPYNFTVQPDLNSGAQILTVQARVTDTGGNVTLSEPFLVDFTDELTPEQAQSWLLSVSDSTVIERDAGTANAVFTVSLNKPSARKIQVDWTVLLGGGAVASDLGTVLPLTGTIEFAPGVTSQTFTIPVQGDKIPERDEEFIVTLSGARNAVISDGYGLGTIIDDDGLGLAPTGPVDITFQGPEDSIDSSTPITASMILDSNDRPVVVSHYASGGGVELTSLTRYLPDGTLDPTFLDNGVAKAIFVELHLFTPLSDPPFTEPIYLVPRSIVTYQSGPNRDKILVSGRGTLLVGSDYLLRFNADGTLDTTFGDEGIAMAPSLTGSFNGVYGNLTRNNLAIYEDGPFAGCIIAGRTRFLPDGRIDQTFSLDGTADAVPGVLGLNAVAIDHQGRVLMAGAAGNSLSPDFVILRYTADGELDPTFSGDGQVTFGTALHDAAYDLEIAPNDDILVAGKTSPSIGSTVPPDYSAQGVLARLKGTDGSLDASFGVNGIARVEMPGAPLGFQHVALRPDGRIVASGDALNSIVDGPVIANVEAIYVSLFDSNGIPDPAIDANADGNGTLTYNAPLAGHPGFFSNMFVHGMDLTSDGQIVVAGNINTPINTPFVIRFEDDRTDLHLSATGLSAVSAGQDITYTISVAGGQDPAMYVLLSDPLPLNTTFVSLDAPVGWHLDTPAVGQSGIVKATLHGLSGQDTPQVLTLKIRVLLTAPPASTIENRITVTSGTLDVATADNSSIVRTTITEPTASFTGGPDVSIAGDAGLQSLANWATNIIVGAGQTPQFQLSTDAPAGFFTQQPAISADGTLSFAAAPGVTGTVTVTTQIRGQGATSLFDDINPDGGSFPTNFVVSGGLLFFQARNSQSGIELWVSDGAVTGTHMVKDILPGPGNSYPRLLTDVNGTLFFAADDGVHGRELWKSDGTQSGTVLVKDIANGAATSIPVNLTNINGTLFFSAKSPAFGSELWSSDGTESGTVMVADIRTRSDSLGNVGSSPSNFVNVNGTLYFSARDDDHGTELWKRDATTREVRMVKDIAPGNDSLFHPLDSTPSTLVNLNGKLLFTATSFVGNEPGRPELWSSDGTDAGTVRLTSTPSGGESKNFGFADSHVVSDGILYFSFTTNSGGAQLWKTDGTVNGTTLVKAIKAGPAENSIRQFIKFNGYIYFAANDGNSGAELWKSDGTAAGTNILLDLFPGGGTFSRNSSNPSLFTEFNGRLYFQAATGAGSELWTTDGTVEGTVVNAHIRPGNGTSNSDVFLVYNNKLFVYASDVTHGFELWSVARDGLPSLAQTFTIRVGL